MSPHSHELPRGAILVLGAGELGMAVLRHLAPPCQALARPLAVLVSPRSLQAPDSAQARRQAELRAMGVRLLSFDLQDGGEAALAALLQPFDTVLNCTGFVAGPGTQTRITGAVLAAGVRRYFPWQFGVDYDIVGTGSGQPVFDEQYAVRQQLRAQSATAWVIVSTGMFTSFLFESAFGLVDFGGDVVRALGSWETRLTVTTPDDIGRLTSAIVLETPAIRDRVVYVAGDTLSYGRLAEIVEEVTGRPFRRELLTPARLAADLAGQPGDGMARYRIAFARGDGMWWDKENTYNAQRGIATVDVRTWLHAHGGLWQSRRTPPGA